MKVLLTGSSGLIGSHLLELLLNSPYEISILQRAGIHSDTAEVPDSRLTVYRADYESVESLQAAVADQHIIIHCAGVTKVRHYSDFFRYNTRATENLIAAVQAVNPKLKRLIYFSSLAAAGPTSTNQPLTEDQTPHPISWYGKSKLDAEELLRQSGLYYTIVRPCAVYGPRDKDIFVYFKLLNQGLAPIIGDGKQQLSLIHVADVAAAVMRILGRLPETRNRTYFLSDDQIYDWLTLRSELIRLFESRSPRSVLKIRVPLSLLYPIAWIVERWNGLFGKIPALNREKVSEMRRQAWTCSVCQAKNDLAFEPVFTLENGLKNTLEWYQTHHWL